MNRNLSGSEKRKLKAIELKKLSESVKKMKPLSVYWTTASSTSAGGANAAPSDDSVCVEVAEFESDSDSTITVQG
jgi:hypothetical protein